MSKSRSLSFVVLAALFGLLAPVLLRGQTQEFPAEPVGAWRARLSERLDRDLAELTPGPRGSSVGLLELRWGSRKESIAPQGLSPLPVQEKSEPFLPMISTVLREHGLPVQLAGIVAIESGFNASALSPKGARGLWQLMPETARRFGLEVSAGRDERLDPLRSTYAAAQYLKKLYGQFGDWPLALAAYNAGEDRVGRAVDRLGARDFWTLSRSRALPEETRRYVPAVLGSLRGFSDPPVPLSSPAGESTPTERSGGSPEQVQVVFALIGRGRAAPARLD